MWYWLVLLPYVCPFWEFVSGQHFVDGVNNISHDKGGTKAEMVKSDTVANNTTSGYSLNVSVYWRSSLTDFHY